VGLGDPNKVVGSGNNSRIRGNRGGGRNGVAGGNGFLKVQRGEIDGSIPQKQEGEETRRIAITVITTHFSTKDELAVLPGGGWG